VILRVGLTGGIASGKSTILGMLRERGCRTVDADAIVSNLYEPGNAGHAALVSEYGTTILREDQRIDRARLAALAFATPEGARKLNSIVHPLVIAEESRLMREAEVASGGDDLIFVVEATLLLESGGRERFDRIVVADVDPQVQIERAVERGMSRDDAKSRLQHQMARERRRSLADYVIDNSGGREALRQAVWRVHERLLEDLREKKKAPGRSPEPSSNE
jgi:dephospho-CoA kinase